MTVGSVEYTGWLDGVRLGLPHFAKFNSGEMSFDPTGAGFSFNGAASGSTLAYLAEDMKKFTGEYGVDISAEAAQVAVEEIAGIDFDGDAVAACQAAFDAVMTTNKVYFASGAAVITRQSGETLDKLMAVSARCGDDLTFELGGHTDSVGSRELNRSLSRERANAVASYMVQAGMAEGRLSAVGYGPDTPVSSNETPEGRSQNRRIEFTVGGAGGAEMPEAPELDVEEPEEIIPDPR